MPEIDDKQFRKELAREILTWRSTEELTEPPPPPVAAQDIPLLAAQAVHKLGFKYPEGLAPVPVPMQPAPDRNDPFPACDVVVVTWTVDEWEALADVFTPGVGRRQYYVYAHNYDALLPTIRQGAPARNLKRLGAYYQSKIGDLRVLVVKSDLHLNQDSIESKQKPGTATLPVKNLFEQMIDETGAKVIITTGTAGGTYADQDLGDVVVTRGAKFRLTDEFKNEPFNDKVYVDDWEIPKKFVKKAHEMMAQHKANLALGPILPPTIRYKPFEPDHCPTPVAQPAPNIWFDDGERMPKFHPILTTDFFEFATSKNGLEKEGCACEMGDAVLGLVVDEYRKAGKPAPNWLVVRNLSDPQINGDLSTERLKNQQAMWAVFFYKGYGYWTSVNGAVACWAVVAGLADEKK